MSDAAETREVLAQWADNQRALARALGLSIDDWLGALASAGGRSTGLTAAVVGAAMARGLGLAILDGLDGALLAARARALLDPRPPRVASPLLKEAIRRADALGVRPGAGASRLRGASGEGAEALAERREVPVPRREARPIGESAEAATPDAPGRAASSRRRSKPRRGAAGVASAEHPAGTGARPARGRRRGGEAP